MTGPECFRCGAPATHRFGNGHLCDDCVPNERGTSHDGESGDGAAESETISGFTARFDAYDDAGWATPESNTYTEERLARKQWMGRAGESGKLPFAPWADRDHPEAAPDEDARWKWGIEDHYVDGETVAIAEDDHRLDGRVFIQREDDPYAFVDGDNVRCPETGEVHPALVAMLEQLGLTYVDVSTSGAGVHANYRGELPDGVKQATFAIDDEPWGTNEDLPEVEIYDGKHVCVVTGDHVPGTPVKITEWDDDSLRAILDANGQLPTERPEEASEAFREFDAKDHEPDATERDEVATDVRDIFAALDRLDARRVADQTIVHQWNDDASTSEGKRAFVPIWGKNANGTANVVDDEIWQDTGGGGYGGAHVMAAIACDDIEIDETATPRDVTGADWWRAVEYLRELGFDIPVYQATDSQDDSKNTDVDVTLDPEVAWKAVDAVAPDDLGKQPSIGTTSGGTEFACPNCGGEIGVVRAAAIELNLLDGCTGQLRDDEYHRAYNYARTQLDAPLPRYVSQETVTENYEVVTGALRDLTYWNFDEKMLNSQVTGVGDEVDGDAVRTLDPAWRDSKSGESVLVFEDGSIYDFHPDHDGVIDALRFAALDAGAITWEAFTSDEFQLTGETFRQAYEIARWYGAPLPEWVGTDAYHTAVLPPADELVGHDDVGNEARLSAAYDDTESEYCAAAAEPGASLMTPLPGVGKTDQVFRQADKFPALYCARRKELMADAVERAAEHGVDEFVLPAFSNNGPPTVVLEAAEAAIRAEGQQILRDHAALIDAVSDRLPDGETLPNPADLRKDSDDEVALDRASCPTANGEYDLGWWLAVHTARARGYRPQQIHENAPALFGEPVPCTCDEHGEESICPYTEAWETATDPEAPFDVLIGHYTHAHVEGARTYAYRPGGKRTQRKPRVVVLDEFPGDAYHREFGDDFPDLAAWLSSCLHENIADRQDLFGLAGDLWHDTTVRAWLASEEVSDEHERVVDRLGTAIDLLQGLRRVDWLLEKRPQVCRDNGLTEPLQTLRDAHPEWSHVVEEAYNDLRATQRDGLKDSLPQVRAALNEVITSVSPVAQGSLSDSSDQPLDGFVERVRAICDQSEHLAGALADLVDEAITAFQDREESARDQLRAAQTALRGGQAGCEALAVHADSGHAHPLAHTLLFGILAAGADAGGIVETSAFGFNDGEGTRLTTVEYGSNILLVDRDHHGALVSDPPVFQADEEPNPVVGLDATGRRLLWELAIGQEVEVRDIHDSDAERRAFLREVYGLQVIQTSLHANSYEGDPTGKNFDDDVELIRTINEQYSDVINQSPAVVTTKVVEETLEDRLADVIGTLAHYGDLNGSTALAENRLAALLGCQHYGDQVIERWAALAGEEVARTGHGMGLDYNSEIGNMMLQHMREDQVMQAALRFGRDTDGALVFAHTAALRDDLPVVAEGEVTRTYSKTAQRVADAAASLRHREQFTSGDVFEQLTNEDVDISRRHVRRVLGELSEAGYLEKTVTANGCANRYVFTEEAPAAEVDLPEIESRAAETPGQNAQEVVYTWSVRVTPGEPRHTGHRSAQRTTLPAPQPDVSATEPEPPPG